MIIVETDMVSEGDRVSLAIPRIPAVKLTAQFVQPTLPTVLGVRQDGLTQA